MEQDTPRPLAWNQLRNTLRLLAAPADLQLRAYPDFVPAASELPEEFDDFYRLVRDHARDRLTDEQWESLAALDSTFEQMTKRDEDLFLETALAVRPEWEEVRRLAVASLRTFRWPLEPQVDETPVDHLTLTPGSRISS